MYDVAIIGCGVIGAAAAYALSQYKLDVVMLEKENDVAMGASRANSAIIHAGYDPKPGTLMAKLNVEGNAMTEALCRALSVPFRRVGSLVIAFSEAEMETLRALYRRGVENGVTSGKASSVVVSSSKSNKSKLLLSSFIRKSPHSSLNLLYHKKSQFTKNIYQFYLGI